MPSSLAYVLSLIPFSPSSVYLTSLLSRSPLFLSLSTLLLFIFPFISCPIYSPPLFLSLYTLLLFIFPFISCPIYSPPLHLPLSFFRDITSLLSLSIFFYQLQSTIPCYPLSIFSFLAPLLHFAFYLRNSRSWLQKEFYNSNFLKETSNVNFEAKLSNLAGKVSSVTYLGNLDGKTPKINSWRDSPFFSISSFPLIFFFTFFLVHFLSVFSSCCCAIVLVIFTFILSNYW